MTGLDVALSAAAIVTTLTLTLTLTLTATIRFQVSDQFDARRATQVGTSDLSERAFAELMS